jgi:hypothetical protein
MTKSNAAVLLKARRAAAKDLGLPLDHWAVKRTALLSVAHANIERALCEGHRVDISDLLKVEAALNEVKAALPAKPLAVTVKIVDGGWPEKQIEGKAVETKPAEPPIEAKAEAPAPPPPPPPPPPPRLDPGVASGSAFHNQVVGGERAPLKRLENVALQNNGHSRSGAFNYGSGSLCFVGSANGQHRDPIAADPHPYRSPTGGDRGGHPLPTPNGKGNGQ